MKAVLRSPLFWLGLVIRVSFLPFFGSSYLHDLFIPFLDRAVLNPLANPWELSPPHFFPYGSALYVFLWIPRFLAYSIFGSSVLGVTPWGIALVKAPLLGMELLLLWALTRFTPKRINSLLIYYWLNPVLIYITHVHGQLDVAAMSFFIVSLLLLVENKTWSSGFVMALATLCKFHVVATLPFMMMFLWSRNFLKPAVKQTASWLLMWAVPTALGMIPLYFAQKLAYVTAASPEAFRIFGFSLAIGENQVLYLGVAVVLAVLGRLCVSTRISEEGLFFGSAAIFGALVLVTRTAPGWYYWIFPFLAVYYSNYFLVPRSLFWAACLFYFFYFAWGPILGVTYPSLLADCLFTVLQTSMLGMIIAMWSQVVRAEVPLSGRARPFLIGIAGDSGTGKNRLSQVLCQLFDVRDVQVLNGDDYHKWERANEKWTDYTHLHPKANLLEQLSEHTNTLLSGKMIFHPQYDHSTGNFTEPRAIRPNRNLIVQGLHTLYTMKMRHKMGLRIFLDPDPQVRLAWKLKRDVSERGHSVENVLKMMSLRVADSVQHILPQKRLADWIIQIVPKTEISEEAVMQGVLPPLLSRHIVYNDVPVNSLARALEECDGCKASVDVLENDIDRVVLTVEGEPEAGTISQVASRLFPNLKHITGGYREPRWSGGHAGIQQLVALCLFSQRMKEI
jgi:uridine kinase